MLVKINEFSCKLSPTERRLPNLVAFSNKQLEQCFVCGRKEREFYAKRFNQVAASGRLGTIINEGKNISFVWDHSYVS